MLGRNSCQSQLIFFIYIQVYHIYKDALSEIGRLFLAAWVCKVRFVYYRETRKIIPKESKRYVFGHLITARIMSTSIAYSNVFLTWKKSKKKENTWKIKKQNFKTKKNRKQNKWEKKGTSKRGKNGKKWTCPFAFFLLFRFACFLLLFCFYFAFFCFCMEKSPKKKQNKSKTKATKKANRKSKKKTTKMQLDKSMFFPFFPLFVFPFCFLFSPFILLLCFLDFADLLFCFSIFFAFFALFSSCLKKE